MKEINELLAISSQAPAIVIILISFSVPKHGRQSYLDVSAKYLPSQVDDSQTFPEAINSTPKMAQSSTQTIVSDITLYLQSVTFLQILASIDPVLSVMLKAYLQSAKFPHLFIPL